MQEINETCETIGQNSSLTLLNSLKNEDYYLRVRAIDDCILK